MNATLRMPIFLGRDQHLAHELIPHIGIAADMHFRLRLLAHDPAQHRLELILARQQLGVPIDGTLLVDGDGDVLRAGLCDQIGGLGQRQRYLLEDDPDGDDENDQQHQHHVH